jgi:two-component system cell cycle sensor histidine kinase/response regulator CckA
MSKKIYVFALSIAALQACEVVFLGTSHFGAFAGNFLQTVASGFAAAMCFGASRRGRGLSRPFWLLAGLGMGCWGLANVGWAYYESWLHVEPPRLSLVRIVFDIQGVFFAAALFLDKHKDSAYFDAEMLLDSLQVAIVFFSVFFGLYYVQLLRGAPIGSTDTIMTWIFIAINLAMAGLAALQTTVSPTRRLRTLFGAAAAFLLFYAVCTGVTDYVQTLNHIPTGTWYDMGWTVPFLAAGLWAGWWKEEEGFIAYSAFTKKTVGSLVIRNLALALAPLIVLALVVNIGPEWRLPGYLLLGISIVCFAVRLGLSEYHQSKSAENVRRHALAMDSSVDGIAMINQQGTIEYANSAYAAMLGYDDLQAVVGKMWKEVSNPADYQYFETEITQALVLSGKWFGPLTIHRRDGTAFSMEMAVTTLPGGGVVCASRDITDRRKAEHALIEAENKFRALIEQVAAISYIAELGIEGQWLYVSPQVEAILGYTPDEWLANSKEWVEHIPAEDRGIVHTAEQASSRGERFQAEYRLIRKDGRIIWVSDTAVVVRGSDSHPVMEGLIVDITDRKLLENQLQQAHRMEAVGRLAGGIAHDFNNLLTIIKGYAELAASRHGVSPALNADIQQIGNAAERASTLVRQLLAFSRKQVMQPRSIDLNTIVLGLDSLLRRLMSEDIEMMTHCEDIVGTVRADPAQIEQVIMNLVVNARDAMPNGGQLTVETANVQLDSTYARDHATVRPGAYVMLAVSDTGTGMDPETQAHIFEPFYTTKGGGHGTGLGLSTVYGIVKQSGGYIWVYSERGKGTTFKVYLPIIDAPVEVKAQAQEVPSAKKGTEAILLVEDEEAVRELARVVLQAQGYQVIEAQNPRHAEELSQIHSEEVQLLLTDVVMPGMSGRDLARRITSKHPKIRVLYMSGYTDNVIASGGVLERGVSFLQKPFTPRALAAKVREVLDTPAVAK